MNDILQHARHVFTIEAESILEVRDRLDTNFEKAISLLLNCRGKVVITGMGKSGRIGQKISATLASTGTASVFLHPSEAAHGDLGVVSPDDLLLTIGKSGESDELTSILPIVKKMGVPIISLLGNLQSTTAKFSDVSIDISVSKEACNLELAPTSSTTASLVMGDALAMVLMELKNFKSEDFALFHPAGQLGKRLLLTVNDIMKKGNELPLIQYNDTTENLIYLMSKFGLGIIGVCNEDQSLFGIITDGDLRRGLEKHKADFFKQSLTELATKDPLTIAPTNSAYDALHLMEKKHTLNHLPVIDNGIYIGMLSLHDLIKAGL